MSTPIYISIPKYLTGAQSPVSPDSINSSDDCYSDSAKSRTKRKRLDHLSWEEKMLRKKLKNRVAAQTSRDRKKAKMDEMENSLNIIKQQNEVLIRECQSLRKLNEKLLAENSTLKQQNKCLDKDDSTAPQSCSVWRVPEQGPAVSHRLPLPKGQGTRQAAALWLAMACLLCRTSSQSSTPQTSNGLQKAFSTRSLRNLEILKSKLTSGQLQIPQLSNLPDWWGRHQNNWNPVEMTAA